MTYEISEMLAAAEADAAAARVRAEASAREAEAARVSAREAKEAAARSAVEAAEIEMAVRLSDHIAGSLKKKMADRAGYRTACRRATALPQSGHGTIRRPHGNRMAGRPVRRSG